MIALFNVLLESTHSIFSISFFFELLGIVAFVGVMYIFLNLMKGR